MYETQTSQQKEELENVQAEQLEDQNDKHRAETDARRGKTLKMPCWHPLDARRSPGGTIGFKPMTPFDKLIKLPCGRCTGCRLERSRQTAVRLMHEAQLQPNNSFLTLTYRDDELPQQRGASSQSLTAPRASPGPRQRTDHTEHARQPRTHEEVQASLSRRDLQLFTKRLNEDARRRFGKGVRYYGCGEYGELKGRPHYHLAVFGEDFADDRQFWKHTKNGHVLWRSSRLTRLWRHGDVDIGELTFDSAAYIARYIFKKVLGTSDKAEKLREKQYLRQDNNGNDYWLEPEFNVMSRGGRGGRGGLGKGWFEIYSGGVYPHDRVITNGHPAKPPRYYDQQLEKLDKELLDLVKARREEKVNPANGSPERLRAGEKILAAKMERLKRTLE